MKLLAGFVVGALFAIGYYDYNSPSREMLSLAECQKLTKEHRVVHYDVFYDDQDGSYAICSAVEDTKDELGFPANKYVTLFAKGMYSRGTPLRPN